MSDRPKDTYVTRTGKVLTDDELEALAEEAEAGYDLARVVEMADTPGSSSGAERREGSTPSTGTIDGGNDE